jgi:hypothetical protein
MSSSGRGTNLSVFIRKTPPRNPTFSTLSDMSASFTGLKDDANRSTARPLPLGRAVGHLPLHYRTSGESPHLKRRLRTPPLCPRPSRTINTNANNLEGHCGGHTFTAEAAHNAHVKRMRTVLLPCQCNLPEPRKKGQTQLNLRRLGS